jgi:hypothetical protein
MMVTRPVNQHLEDARGAYVDDREEHLVGTHGIRVKSLRSDASSRHEGHQRAHFEDGAQHQRDDTASRRETVTVPGSPECC